MDLQSWYAGKTALVTGASSGIGRVFALELARLGCPILAVGRDGAALEALAAQVATFSSQPVTLLPTDLSRNEAVAELVQRLVAGPSPQIVINNAGLGHMGPLLTMEREKALQLMQVNMTALVLLSQGLLPTMQGRGGCGILNVGSVASFFPTPGSTLYGASKHFVAAYTDALHQEMLPLGIHVTGLYPGAVHSRFLQRGTDGRHGDWHRAMTPQAVVLPALAGLAANRRRVVPGAVEQLRVFLAMVLPVSWIMQKSLASARSLYPS